MTKVLTPDEYLLDHLVECGNLRRGIKDVASLPDTEVASSYELIARFGRTFEMKPCPEEFWGEMGACYDNAYDVVSEHLDYFTYVEGFALSPNVGFPMLHAWLLDNKDGKAFDPTWYAPMGSAYRGLTIPFDVLCRQFLRNSCTGVLDGDWQGGFTFLKGGWRDCIAH